MQGATYAMVTFRKYLVRLLSARMTVTFAVLLQAERPQDSAEMTLVPFGMAAARRPCQRQDRTCWALFYLQRRPCE